MRRALGVKSKHITEDQHRDYMRNHGALIPTLPPPDPEKRKTANAEYFHSGIPLYFWAIFNVRGLEALQQQPVDP